MAIAQPTAVVFEYGQDGTHTIALDPTEDITGWTISYTVKAYNGGTTLITKTTSSGITVTSYSLGIFVVDLTASDLALTYGPGAYVGEAHRSNAGFTYPIVDPFPFIIRPSNSTDYPTITNLGEYAAHSLNGITLTDAMSQQLIQLMFAAERRVKQYCQRDFVFRTATEYYDGTGNDHLRLRRTPVSPTGLTIYEDWDGYGGTPAGSFAADTLLAVGEDFYLPLDNKFGDALSYSGIVNRINAIWPSRRVRRPSLLSYNIETLPGCIKVTYTGGFRLIPHDLKWCVWQLMTLMDRSSSMGALPYSQSGEGYSSSAGQMDTKSGLPQDVKGVLDMYRDGATMIA